MPEGRQIATKMVHYRGPTKVGIWAWIRHKNGVTQATFVRCHSRYYPGVKITHSRKRAKETPAVNADIVRVLVAGSGTIQSQLLARALRARRNFRVATSTLEVTSLRQAMQVSTVDVVLVAGDPQQHFSLLRWLHVSYPAAATVLLVESYDRELVVNAFRVGVKGIFLFSHYPFRTLCRCITCVAKGQVWMNSQQTHYVLEALSEVSTLRVVNSSGKSLLTPREEQVVALVA
jgi:DNA-binding NarL/FixJ family response regulator